MGEKPRGGGEGVHKCEDTMDTMENRMMNSNTLQTKLLNLGRYDFWKSNQE